jgi:hypothetical protein
MHAIAIVTARPSLKCRSTRPKALGMDLHEPDMSLAAAQQAPGTMAAVASSGSAAVRRGPRRPLWTDRPGWGAYFDRIDRKSSMSSPSKPREVFIQGITLDGKTFRPSDWAERLAGAMSCFRPGRAGAGITAFIGYSPYCVPVTLDGVKCVVVSEALRDVEPMAWDFVMNFARDNRLQVVEACLLPDGTRTPRRPEDAPPTA